MTTYPYTRTTSIVIPFPTLISSILLITMIGLFQAASAQNDEDMETGLIEEKWCPPQCECFNNYETVDCSRRRLTVLPRLSQATHKLYLENNKLQELTEISFLSTPRLQILILEHNRIVFLTTAVFCPLHHLQELDLSSNQLSFFKIHLDPDDNFLNFPFFPPNNSTTTPMTPADANNISKLISTTPLSYPPRETFLNTSTASASALNETLDDEAANEMPSFTSTTSSPTPSDYSVDNENNNNNFNDNDFKKCECPGLKEINLSHNQLKNIPYAVARFAPDLEILNLAYNQITSLRFDPTYSLLASLRYLDVSRNDLRSINADDFLAFKKAPKLSLESINLSDCGLVFIEASAFVDLPSLNSLSLARSLVNKTVLESVFTAFPLDNHLGRLDLSEMFLSNISLEMVSHFRRLSSLVASYCDIERVEEGVFEALSNLESLHLEGGQLRQLEGVTKLKGLRRISLHLNQLSSLQLNGSPVLEYVDLSYNKFSEWEAGWLVGAEEIQQLNMSHNQLTYLSREAFRRVFSISSLDLSHNALSTLSSMGSLKVTHLDLSSNSLSGINDDFFDILHQTLVSLDLSFNLFTLFRSTFKIFHQLQTLNLANNKLGGAFKSDRLGNLMASLQSVQILDLSSNDISAIHPFHFQPLTHLHTLFLHDNKIRGMSDVSLDGLKLLSKLVISRNQLHTLDVQVLTNLEYLEEIDASGNPFECTCDLAEFLRWTNSTQTAVLSTHGQMTTYLCDYPPDLYGVTIFDPEVEGKVAKCPYAYAGFGEAEDNVGKDNGGIGVKDGGSDNGVGGNGGYEVVGVNYYNEDNKNNNGNEENNNQKNKKHNKNSKNHYGDNNNNKNTNNHFSLYGSRYLIGSLSFLCLIGGVGCIGVTCYVTQVFKRMKGLKYRWQIRYREVSAVENEECK